MAPFDTLPLSEVVLVAAADVLPLQSSSWPVRVVSLTDWTSALDRSPTKAYFFGTLSSLRCVLDALTETPLGLIVDSADHPLCATTHADVLDLDSGFTERIWEKVVSIVCHRHIETMQHIVFGHARRTPSKTAVVFKDRKLTYQQLLSSACSFADHLRSLSLTGTIGCLLTPSDLAVIAYLGIYCGGNTVHYLTNHAADRAYRLSVAETQAIVCCSGTDVETDLPKVYIDTLKLNSSRPLDSLRVCGSVEDVAFIEYTSGSTGKPKAMASVQKRMAHWTRWRTFFFPPAEHDLVAYNLFFIWYFQLPITQGATIGHLPIGVEP